MSDQPDAAAPPLGSIGADLQIVRNLATEADEAARTARLSVTAPTQDDEDRSLFARLLVRMFITTLAVYLLFLVLQWTAPGGSPDIAARAEDMIKSVLVPIVTLVLGYYFGQSRRS